MNNTLIRPQEKRILGAMHAEGMLSDEKLFESINRLWDETPRRTSFNPYDYEEFYTGLKAWMGEGKDDITGGYIEARRDPKRKLRNYLDDLEKKDGLMLELYGELGVTVRGTVQARGGNLRNRFDLKKVTRDVFLDLERAMVAINPELGEERFQTFRELGRYQKFHSDREAGDVMVDLEAPAARRV